MAQTPHRQVPGDQNWTPDGKEIHTATSTTATSAGGITIPAQARGYIIVNIGGVDKKIPYYDV
jgi:hypothetical protein